MNTGQDKVSRLLVLPGKKKGKCKGNLAAAIRHMDNATEMHMRESTTVGGVVLLEKRE